MADAFRNGFSLEDVFNYTSIDPWFLAEIEDLLQTEAQLASCAAEALTKQDWYSLKRKGFSDSRLAVLLDSSEATVRSLRQDHGVKPVYRRVDTCAAEFPATSAYMYSTYEEECESNPSDRKKIMVLAAAPTALVRASSLTLLCACRVGDARRWLRNHHGQL